MDEPLTTQKSKGVSRAEIEAMSKESALELLKELYSRDPDPFFQAFAKSRTSLEAVYYGIITGER
jgi:hypothetical protein